MFETLSTRFKLEKESKPRSSWIVFYEFELNTMCFKNLGGMDRQKNNQYTASLCKSGYDLAMDARLKFSQLPLACCYWYRDVFWVERQKHVHKSRQKLFAHFDFFCSWFSKGSLRSLTRRLNWFVLTVVTMSESRLIEWKLTWNAVKRVSLTFSYVIFISLDLNARINFHGFLFKEEQSKNYIHEMI